MKTTTTTTTAAAAAAATTTARGILIIATLAAHLTPIDPLTKIARVLGRLNAATTVIAALNAAMLTATCSLRHLLAVFVILLLAVIRVLKVVKVGKVITVVAHAKVTEVKDLRKVIVRQIVIDHRILIVLHIVVKVIEAEKVLGVLGAGRVIEAEGVVGMYRGIVHHHIVLPVVAVVITQIVESRQGGVIVLTRMMIMTTSRCLDRLLNVRIHRNYY